MLNSHNNPMHSRRNVPQTNSMETPNLLPAGAGVALGPCQSYTPGHSIHFIQAKLATSEHWEHAHIVAASGNNITFKTMTATLTRWNHEPRTLQMMSDIAILMPDAIASWSARYFLLKIECENGSIAVSLGESDGGKCALPRTFDTTGLGYKGRPLFTPHHP